jgi:hypothetical protein
VGFQRNGESVIAIDIAKYYQPRLMYGMNRPDAPVTL